MFRELLRGESLADVGEHPDYRFTLANERTFLAWIRTSMALVAGGLGLLNLLPDQTGSTVLGLAVLAMAVVTSVASYRRWFRAERAMRQNQPLPPSQLPRIVALAVATLALVGALLFVAAGPS